MAGSFKDRIEELQDKVGRGKLVMRTNVHQPYAAAEHQKIYKHPHGGGPKFVENPFMDGFDEMLQNLAESFPELEDAAIEQVGKFQEWVETYAPQALDVLKQSVNLYVENDGSTIFEKPQEAPYESWKE